MKRKSFHVAAMLASLIVCSTTIASEDTRGADGINSAALTLTGAGVSIGQVEFHRPGKFGDGFDDGAHSNFGTIPEGVYIEDGITPTWNSIAQIISSVPPMIAHATLVAGVMISSDPVAPGIAQEADLYASAGGQSTPVINTFDKLALSAQYVATRDNDKVAAINMSFAVPFEPGGGLDGNSKVTQFIDWSAKKHDTLYVTGGFESGVAAGIAQPLDNFNGLKVGASAKDGGAGKFQRVADFNVFIQHPESNRTLIDLIAPGEDIELADIGAPIPPTVLSGTSYAAPLVVGTVALLQEHANSQIPSTNWDINGNARRHEVMKAVLMNSADKLLDDGSWTPPNGNPVPIGGLLGMERTVYKKPQEGNPNPTWFDSTAYDDRAFEQGAFVPLDDEMGAGHLNANRAFKQFSPGEYEADDPDIPLIGWDYGTTAGTGFSNINNYSIAEDLLGNSFISITLAWDRVVAFQPAIDDLNSNGNFDAGEDFADYTQTGFEPQADSVINDLRLWLLPESAATTAGAIASSDFNEGTVEHIFFQIPETGRYKIWVEQTDNEVSTGQDYAIAWWAAGVPSESTPGDFNSDGNVDGADLDEWKSGFGTTYDGADFLTWQRNFGTTSVAAVPEPSALMLSVLGLAFVCRRR